MQISDFMLCLLSNVRQKPSRSCQVCDNTAMGKSLKSRLKFLYIYIHLQACDYRVSPSLLDFGFGFWDFGQGLDICRVGPGLLLQFSRKLSYYDFDIGNTLK